MRRSISLIFLLTSLIVLMHAGLYGQEKVKNSIAVLPLDAHGLKQHEAATVTDRLRDELLGMNLYQVMESNKMHEILEEQGLTDTDLICTETECFLRIGKMLGVQQIVGGSVRIIRDVYNVSIRMIDVETGKTILTADENYPGEFDGLLTITIPYIAKPFYSINDSTAQSDPTILEKENVRNLFETRDFYDRNLNPSGQGINNQYKLLNKGQIVFDKATNLMWQQGGSNNEMIINHAKQYIAELNRINFAGYSDWRLPTLEEAMSLMEPEKNSSDLHIDSVFDSKQKYIWTNNQINDSKRRRWAVYFNYGDSILAVHYNRYVRAVRSR